MYLANEVAWIILLGIEACRFLFLSYLINCFRFCEASGSEVANLTASFACIFCCRAWEAWLVPCISTPHASAWVNLLCLLTMTMKVFLWSWRCCFTGRLLIFSLWLLPVIVLLTLVIFAKVILRLGALSATWFSLFYCLFDLMHLQIWCIWLLLSQLQNPLAYFITEQLSHWDFLHLLFLT